jgi:glucose/arabinose dehydrogenase
MTAIVGWLLVAAAVAAGSPAAPESARAPGTLRAQVVVRGLDHPAAFDVAPGGDIFYGERVTGEIRVWRRDRDRTVHFFDIPDLEGAVLAGTGLLALTLDPAYPDVPYLYLLATRRVGATVRTQVLRVTDAGGEGEDLTVLFGPGLGAGDQHNGGKIAFGPDGMLYVVIGERTVEALAQDLDSPHGKVLRLTPDGGIPDDNPFGPDNPTYAYGIRNSFGMAFDPATGYLWESDNGPACNDELNRIEAGGNYGWGPSETCATPPPPPQNTNADGPDPIMPELVWGATIAPTGLAFCTACGLGRRSEGALFLGDFNDRRIHRILLSDNGRSVESESIVLTHLRRVLSVEAAPGGSLYFSDAKGIYRIVST